MGGYALPHLNTPTETAIGANELQQGKVNLQLGQQKVQENQIALKDQQAQTAALQEWDPSKGFDQLPALIQKHGGSLGAVTGAVKAAQDWTKGKQEIAKNDLENGTAKFNQDKEKNDMLLGHLQGVLDDPSPNLSGRLAVASQQAVQAGLLDPPHLKQVQGLIATAQNDADLRAKASIFGKTLQAQSVQYSQIQAQKKSDLETAQAAAATQNATTNALEADTKAKEFTAKQPGGALYSPTDNQLQIAAVKGDPIAEAAIKRGDESKRAGRPVNNLMTRNDAKDIADAIESGDQAPTLQGLYRNAGPVRAELARRGVPLAKMESDWKATQKFLGTLNGTQQTRLRQDISVVSDSLDKIEGLYDQWKQLAPQSGFKILNKATLAAMKQLPGQPGAIAQALDAQIADTTAGLGTIYMGGNSPTDHSLSLAAKSLSADWNDATFTEALKQARFNVKIRQNSIVHAQPSGVGNEYMPGNSSNSGASATVNMKAPNGTIRPVPSDQVEHFKKLGATVVP